MNDRDYWISVAERLALPILDGLSRGKLRKTMPVETNGGPDRAIIPHLEAFGRLVVGVAPWLASKEKHVEPLVGHIHSSLHFLTDPSSEDCCDFGTVRQTLVEMAFLAQGLLRARDVLWEPLDSRLKRRILDAFRATRAVRPNPSNWLLFSAMIETALCVFGERDWDRMRIAYAIRQHMQWYQGDGCYGDGPQFHADYYNSFVIHPMLVDIIRHVADLEDWKQFEAPIFHRARRCAAILERLIAPDGSFPPLGRSLCYRFGAFHLLAQMALLQQLPDGISAAQVRAGLTAVIRRVIEAPGTFDERGWLRVGFCGSQPAMGEDYISTGSLYLCSTALLPLGLPSDAPFWSGPSELWTSAKIWSGYDAPADHSDS